MDPHLHFVGGKCHEGEKELFNNNNDYISSLNASCLAYNIYSLSGEWKNVYIGLDYPGYTLKM